MELMQDMKYFLAVAENKTDEDSSTSMGGSVELSSYCGIFFFSDQDHKYCQSMSILQSVSRWDVNRMRTGQISCRCEVWSAAPPVTSPVDLWKENGMFPNMPSLGIPTLPFRCHPWTPMIGRVCAKAPGGYEGESVSMPWDIGTSTVTSDVFRASLTSPICQSSCVCLHHWTCRRLRFAWGDIMKRVWCILWLSGHIQWQRCCDDKRMQFLRLLTQPGRCPSGLVPLDLFSHVPRNHMNHYGWDASFLTFQYVPIHLRSF